ncbi:response regulator [Asticcacaulis sp. DXS10W]|uniref:Response regulator n=1 Tax=Asticcacaulis currens TaxID=2984210 RepID=A0ABT5IBH8_9CAUL|nr:response regulator [Asticcacaulis currens]MDC7693488.1 response regulator [Asticcacaulis currens]
MPNDIVHTCLIVDDSRTVRKYARSILEHLAFEVSEARNGAHALLLCERNMPDAILLDWNMPVMDGLTFLKELRGLGSIKQPRVVFCTTEGDMVHVSDALCEGADEYIIKPFDDATVAHKFRQIGLV